MYGYVLVDADSASEAVQEAMDAPLPDNGDYIEGSFEVDEAAMVDEDDDE